MRVLLDTNVILDVALQRPGLFEGSRRALEKCEDEGHELRVAWHTLSNLFYLLRKDRGSEKAVDFLRSLLTTCEVTSVGHADAIRAVDAGLNDFEDALQLTSAEACQASVIITRNKADFGTQNRIAVLTPEEFAPANTGPAI